MDGADSARSEETKMLWRSILAASHRVPRAMPTNTDLVPTHGKPRNVKEDPAR